MYLFTADHYVYVCIWWCCGLTGVNEIITLIKSLHLIHLSLHLIELQCNIQKLQSYNEEGSFKFTVVEEQLVIYEFRKFLSSFVFVAGSDLVWG